MDSKTLSGVKCDVESCLYNKNGKRCSASTITVDSTADSACCCEETACKTFISRN
ncbi:MAG: DUF1540 domain-containing protein [Ruminococcus sp.]|nr:DUF1540 domain-containing protein [Ruminococcus sp.]